MSAGMIPLYNGQRIRFCTISALFFCTFFSFMLCSFLVAFFLCCTIFMLLFCVALLFCWTFFVLLHSFHVALLCVKFFRTGFLWKLLDGLPLFHMLCETCNLEILWKCLQPNSSICYFFQTSRRIANVLQACCNKERIKAPIEHDRCTAIGIKIDDRNFSTLFKVSITRWGLPD